MGIPGRDTHRNELSVPAPAKEDPDSVEIARIWCAGGRQVVTLRAEIWENPAAWGLMLVDFAKHVANAYEQLGRGSKDEILRTIRQGFDAEWSAPTDDPSGSIDD